MKTFMRVTPKETAMEWLSQNWVWLLFIGAMVAMHLFGHGGHGGHGKTSGGHGGCGGGHAGSAEVNDEERPKAETRHMGH